MTSMIWPVIMVCNSNGSNPDLSDLVGSCEFKEKDCQDYDQFFSYFYDQKYGDCYRLNSGTNMKEEPVKKKVTNQGGDGFYLGLFTGIKGPNQNDFARLFISDQV